MQPIEAADYHDLAFPSDPRVAPDGDRVAFVRTVPTDDETTQATVHVVPTDRDANDGDDARGPRRFTVAEGQDSEPRWSPSGDRLAFVSTRGADDDRPQLWVLPTAGGEARQVTDVAGGVSNVAWAPDGERIAFVQQASAEDREEERDVEVPEEFEPDEPDPRVIDRTVYRSAERYFDGKRSHVYVVDLGDDAPGGE
ncbi:MAG: S9 family peptidase, partial [Haloarculaceae archaeon]